MDGKSFDVKMDKLEKIKEIIPEVFSEGKIDWEKLKAVLGDDVEFKNERYVLNWAGKSDAFRVLQAPTTATLLPCREESVDFDNTENLFIEGENLEVLKVLQKAYYGKIKMIYIDPPYNTGNDYFIYPDRFSETRDEYLGRIGDKDETGYMTREGLFRKNSKDSGHYHSNWMSMMYPRLFLARNLLRGDGIIFISIDDNEFHNLRLLMNEIFGEENILGVISNINNPKGRSDDKFLATAHEYIIVASKNVDEAVLGGFEADEKIIKRYNKIDRNEKRYREIDLRKTGDEDLKKDRPDMFYYFYFSEEKDDLIVSKGQKTKLAKYLEITPQREDGQEGRWRWGFETSRQKINELKAKFMPNRKVWTVIEKDYLDDRALVKPTTAWTFKDVNSERGSEQFIELGFSKETFPRPKPIGTLKRILEIGILSHEKSIVMDFFSGSCGLSQAVIELTKDNGKDANFIVVQLPEKCDESSEAFKAGYKTIADIGKERVRRVIKKIKDDQSGKLPFKEERQDLGFKVFKLRGSNFKIWRPKIESENGLLKQMELHTDPVNTEAETENILYELLLKSGVPLTAKIEEKNNVFLVNDNEIALILDKIDEDIIKFVINVKPQKIITLDRLFENNDQLKTNTALQMKDAGIEFKAI